MILTFETRKMPFFFPSRAEHEFTHVIVRSRKGHPRNPDVLNVFYIYYESYTK